VLKHLEQSRTQGSSDSAQSIAAMSNQPAAQLSFFQLDDPSLAQIREEILNIDINNLTPVEALMKLNEIRKIVVGY